MSNWPVVVMVLAHNYGGGVRSTLVQVSGGTTELGALADAMDRGKPLTIHIDAIRFYDGKNYRPIAEYVPAPEGGAP